MAISFLNKYDIAIPKHFSRYCIYDEIKAVLESKKITQEQYNKLLEDCFPKKYGLTENNIIFRKHNLSGII